MAIKRRSKRPPSIIVAADGTGDYTTIAAALAAVPAAGATVLVKRGTYAPSGVLSLSVANTRIVGEGSATIVRAPGGTANTFNIPVADCSIEDLQIDGLRASQTVNLSSANNVGVYVTAPRACLKRLYIHDTRSNGVSAEGASAADITIENCVIEGGATSSAGTTGGHNKGIFCSAAIRPTIRGNIIRGWSQAVGLWYGVLDGLVEGNQIRDNYGFEDLAHTVKRSACEDYGASEVHGHNRWINNLIDGSTSHCLEIAQGVVGSSYCNNVLKNPGIISGTGVHVEVTGDVPGPTTDILIDGNFITGTSNTTGGIMVNGVADGITITKNRITGLSNGSHAGAIFIGGTAVTGQVAVEGNVISTCNRAIRLNSNANGQTVHGNKIRDCPSGIFIGSGKYHLIDGNDILRATGNAVDFNTGGDSSRFTNNYITSSQVAGVVLIERPDILVEGNYVECTVAGAYGALRWYGANALRGIAQKNILTVVSGGRALYVDGGADYLQFTDNQVLSGTLTLAGDAGSHNVIEPNHTSTLTKPTSLKSLGAKTVNIAQVTIAHGLGYAPTVVTVTPTSTGMVWKSAASDSTNVYLSASADGTTAEVYVR